MLEQTKRALDFYPIDVRRCDLGLCIAYSERPEQTERNARIIVYEKLGMIQVGSRPQKGHCQANGADVITGSGCGIGDALLARWLDQTLGGGAADSETNLPPITPVE